MTGYTVIDPATGERLAHLSMDVHPSAAEALTAQGEDIVTWVEAGCPDLESFETADGIGERQAIVASTDPLWGLAFLDAVEARGLEVVADDKGSRWLAEWNEEQHPRVPAGSGDTSGEFAGGQGSGTKAKKAPKAAPVSIETKKLAYADVKAGGTFKAVSAKHGMTQGQLAGHVWKVDQAKKKINEALEETQSVAGVVKAKDVLPQDVLGATKSAAPPQIWSKMTADEKLTAVTKEGYVWKEKANSKSGNHAWFDKNGVQVSGYAQKDQYKEQLNTIHNGEGLAQFKAPEVTAESTGDWPITNTVERSMSAGYESKVTEAFKPWVGKLSSSEKESVGSYSGSGYSALNEELRSGGQLSSYAAGMNKNIHSAIDKAPKPPPPELVWRGLSSPAASKLFAGLSPGDQFVMNGVQSTSIKPSFAHSWAHGNLLFEIKPAKGGYIKSLSSHKHEYEYILPHAAKYTVRGVSYVKLEGVSAKTKVLQIEMHP